MTSALRQASRWLGRCWAMLREVSGDDAYERYLAHVRECPMHAHAELTRTAFFAAEQRRKWDGVRRCC